MTRRDLERFVRQNTGVTTPGDRDRVIEQMLRHRPAETDDDNATLPVGMDMPPGFSKGDGTRIFTPASSVGYARYIGRAVPNLQTIDLLWRVTTLGAAPTYAEWGLASSEEPVLGASLTLGFMSTLGYTDVSGPVTSAGRKLTRIEDIEQVSAGAHLWLIFVHQGSTGLVLRGGLPQEGGMMLSKAGAARPSTMADSAQFDEVGFTLEDIWIIVKQNQA